MDQLGEMKNLISVVLVEKDNHGDVLPVWAYPAATEDQEQVLLARSNLENEVIPLPFIYSKYKSNWLYTRITPIESSSLPRVVAFGICLIATDFNPEKYFELTQVMATLYSTSADPVKLLECWLSVFTRGTYKTETGLFASANFDPKKSLLVSSIKDVVKFLGEEIILVWAALLMKKRIVVVCEKLSLLQKLIRAFPTLVWHRQSWTILRPFMTLSSHEIEDLKSANVYCAGFTDESIKEQENLYDLLVDLNSRSVSVPAHAKADFVMTIVHKDICDLLVSKAEDANSSDQDLIKLVAIKTKDLIGKIEKLKTEHEDGTYVDWKTLQNTKLPPNMDRFLYSVATAEGMTKGM